MAKEDWDIHESIRENRRTYLKVSCKLCGKMYDRVRQDGLGKKACCGVNPKADILPIGIRFNMLTNLGVSHSDNGIVYDWLCDCGNVKKLRAPNVKLGHTKSCGCLKEKLIGRSAEKHGLSGTKEYRTWRGIIARTEVAYDSTRKWYFDKGVEVCDSWRKSFVQFHKDMGDCPEGYTLDRIDPDGNYCKDNCRWASVDLQSINKGGYSNNTSGVKGVSLNKKSGKYVAYIYCKNKRYALGSYTTLEEASLARAKAEKEIWKNITE